MLNCAYLQHLKINNNSVVENKSDLSENIDKLNTHNIYLLFNDSFDNNQLDSRWKWIDPVGDSNYSLTDRPSWLLITSPPYHDLYISASNRNAPRILAHLPGYVIVKTKLEISTTTDIQGGGILIWFNETNFYRFNLLQVGFNSYSIILMAIENDVVTCNEGNSVASTSIFLEIEKNYSYIITRYSLDGKTWINLKNITTPFEDVWIGMFSLSAHNDYSTTTSFNWFSASSPDSDNDGMPDTWELLMGLNVTDPTDANEDKDLDGMPNLWEYHLWEYQMGLNATDPTDANEDKDLDGMPNLWEYQMGLNATNPNDANEDKDLDGMPNLWEYPSGNIKWA
ncbi:MAG: DUF1349 domain-containing protein [Candidatus Helarchaeota archaeon]